MNLFEYQNLLIRIGLQVEAIQASPGSFLVREGGLNYVFEHNENDPYYFRFVLPGIANVADLAGNLNTIINEFNVLFKVSKIIIQGTQLHLVAEQYVFDFTTLELVIKQIMPIMAQEIQQLHQRIIQHRNEQGNQ